MAKGRRLSKPVKAAFLAEPNGKFRAKGEMAPARSKNREKQPVKHAVVLKVRSRGQAIKHSAAQVGS